MSLIFLWAALVSTQLWADTVKALSWNKVTQGDVVVVSDQKLRLFDWNRESSNWTELKPFSVKAGTTAKITLAKPFWRSSFAAGVEKGTVYQITFSSCSNSKLEGVSGSMIKLSDGFHKVEPGCKLTFLVPEDDLGKPSFFKVATTTSTSQKVFIEDAPKPKGSQVK